MSITNHNCLLLKTTALSLLLLSAFSCSSKEKEKPNILIILLDDAGYADFGFMGSEDLKTPNIDRLAAQGTIFSDAHVTASVSGPSRVAIMTGRHGQRFGHESNSLSAGIPDNETTLGDVFKENGYTTGAIGKWHIGKSESQLPKSQGFDFFYGMLSGGRSYFDNPESDDKAGSYNNILRNNTQERFDGYLTDVFTDEAINFMNSSEQSFLLYLAYNAVHTPMHATKEDLALFELHPRQKLAAMTWALDRGIGRVVESLESSGKLENTLIFFLSDNGGATTNNSSNLPLKGFKGTKFEGGHRIPFFVTWGDKFKSSIPFEGLTSSLDIFATAMDAAGITPEIASNKLDGESLLPYLNNEKAGSPHASLFFKKRNIKAIRHGDYKFIMVDGVDSSLYNISSDISEMNDLIDKEPEKRAELSKIFNDWNSKCIPAPRWDETGWKVINDNLHARLINNQIFKADDL